MNCNKSSYKPLYFDIVEKCSCKHIINEDICSYINSIPEFKELYDKLTTNVFSKDNILDFEKMLFIILCEIKGILIDKIDKKPLTGDLGYLYQSCLDNYSWSTDIIVKYQRNKSKYLHYDYTQRDWFKIKCPNQRIIKYIEEDVERCGLDGYYVNKNEYETTEDCRVPSVVTYIIYSSFITFLLNVITEPKMLDYFKLIKKNSQIYSNLRHILCVTNNNFTDCHFDNKCSCAGSLGNKLFTLLQNNYLNNIFLILKTYKDFNFYYSSLFN